MTTSPTIFDALRERDEALARVEQAAPVEWKDAARLWLRDYLLTHPSFFPDTDTETAPQPPERRAWGPIIQAAARHGWIVRTAEMRPRRYGHATPAAVWASKLYSGS